MITKTKTFSPWDHQPSYTNEINQTSKTLTHTGYFLICCNADGWGIVVNVNGTTISSGIDMGSHYTSFLVFGRPNDVVELSLTGNSKFSYVMLKW